MTFAIWLIALAELFGTSLWFSANAAADGLAQTWGLSKGQLGMLTGAVQLGFIAGTLTVSLTGLADRFAASRIFSLAAALGASLNLAFGATGDFRVGLGLRFLTGVALAGIYPVGMKLIVSWAPHKAGQSLGLLVGMLTLGTALPHAVRGAVGADDFRLPIWTASTLALVSACIVHVVGDGPHLATKKKAKGSQLRRAVQVFAIPRFRAAALGYFGHMWELYAFWTVLPFLMARQLSHFPQTSLSVSMASFAGIGVGCAGCMVGGWLSQCVGEARVAGSALTLSGIACLAFPWVVQSSLSPWLGVVTLALWGVMVVADSPQFSALSARACPPDQVAGALAIQNGIGFLISVVSIGVATSLFDRLDVRVAWLLVPGPVLGLLGMRRLLASQSSP